jgi:hypothetical protein
MLKALLFATMFLVMGDLAIDHGEQTLRVVQMGARAGHTIAEWGEASIFTK